MRILLGIKMALKQSILKFNWEIIWSPAYTSVKVMNLAIVDGEYVALNINKIDKCGAVTGTGKTIQEARDNCEKNAKEVKADGLIIDVPSKEDIENKIKELKQFGINF